MNDTSRSSREVTATSPTPPSTELAQPVRGSARDIRVVKLPRPEEHRQPEVEAGQQLGDYRLLQLIASGSSGRLFEVEHVSTGRRAMMKVLGCGLEAAGAVVATARAVDQLAHSHLAAWSEIIEGPPPAPATALVRERLEGRSLAQLAAEGPLDIERLVSIGAQILDALGALHEAGLVHGNLEPENVFLVNRAGTSDFVLLLDAGLPGTSAYAAPEAISGAVDQGADIYAFGVLLFELLCGWLPFEAGPAAAPPAAPRRVTATATGRTLDAVARRCLREDPAQRWRSVKELKRVLDALLCEEAVDLDALDEDQPERAVPVAADEAPDDDLPDGIEQPRRGKVWLVGGALAALAVAGIALSLRGKSTAITVPVAAVTTARVTPAPAPLATPSPPAEPAPVAKAKPAPVAKAKPAPVAKAEPAPVAKAEPRPAPKEKPRPPQPVAVPARPAKTPVVTHQAAEQPHPQPAAQAVSKSPHPSPSTPSRRRGVPVNQEGTVNPFGN